MDHEKIGVSGRVLGLSKAPPIENHVYIGIMVVLVLRAESCSTGITFEEAIPSSEMHW